MSSPAPVTSTQGEAVVVTLPAEIDVSSAGPGRPVARTHAATDPDGPLEARS
jgi:hypothetical protein